MKTETSRNLLDTKNLFKKSLTAIIVGTTLSLTPTVVSAAENDEVDGEGDKIVITGSRLKESQYRNSITDCFYII